MSLNLNIVKKWSTYAGFILCVVFIIYGLNQGLFTSRQSMTLFLQEAGYLAPLVFVLIQIIQCIVPIIPGGISCVIGVAMFGPVYGFIYNYIGICIGSIIDFLIARKYGKEKTAEIISQKNYDRYITWLDKGKRFDAIFALAILIPGAPDDILCYIAGLTKISTRRFVLIILLLKPLSIYLYSIGYTSVTGFIQAHI